MGKSFSDFAESGILNHLLRTSTFSKPSLVAVALCSNVPADNQTGATIPEVTDANGYARVNLGAPADADWDFVNVSGPGGSGTTQNAAAITFPTATGDWGMASGIAICNASGVGTGQVIFHGKLSTARDIKNNDQFSFPIGNLDIFLS